MTKTRAKLGQHFLRSQKALGQIVDAGDIHGENIVLEIGPGKGVLTRSLLSLASKVIAIEKDTALCQELRQTFAHEINVGTLDLIEGDALDFEPAILKNYNLNLLQYKVVANIPYYITGLIFRKFLTSEVQPVHMVVLIQKEVARRIIDKKESLLSLSVKAFGNPKIAATVPRGSFSPPPQVDSAILTISDISRSRFADISEDRFFKILHAGFAAKRKMLAGNLQTIASKEKIVAALIEVGIPEKARAEDVHLEQWIALTKVLS